MDELIRDLQEREELSFEEAQYYLKKAGGDLDRAIYLVYKRKNSWCYKFDQALKDKITAFWQYRIVICRADRMFINIPFYIFFFLILVFSITEIEFLPLLLVMVGLVMLSGSEMSLARPEADKMTMPVSRYLETEQKKAVETAPPVSRVAFPAETGCPAPVKAEMNVQPAEKTLGSAAEQGWQEYSEIVIK